MINETLEQNKNSIELALSNFLMHQYKITEKFDDEFKKVLGVEISTVLPFGDYLELGYALDKFDQEVPHDEKSVEGAKLINQMLEKHKTDIIANLEEQKEDNPKFKTRKEAIENLIKLLQGVKESLTIGVFVDKSAKELSEAYNYSTVIPEDVYESIKKWLETEEIPFTVGENNELVVECGDRDTVYHVDRYLTKALKERHKVMDTNIYLEVAEPDLAAHKTFGDYVEELNNIVAKDDLEVFDGIIADTYRAVGITYDEMPMGELVNSLNPREQQELLDRLHALSYDYELSEAAKDNFSIDDLKELEGISDLQAAKTKALQMIQGTDTSAKIKPAKQEYFKRQIAGARNVMALVDMFYQMMLSGDGLGRIGTTHGMGKSTYRQSYESDMAEAKKRPQDMTSYDLMKMGKPRIDPAQQPKAGAFDKDTKTMMIKKDPLGRKTTKHKGRMFESKELKEQVLGMTPMPTIMRMRALAGIEGDPSETEYRDTTSEMTEQSESYMIILDHLAAIQSLLPNISMSEYKELIASIEAMTDEFEL